jgi:hypothetical protein
MNRTLYLLALALLLPVFAGCEKTPVPEPTPDCVGEWQLSQIETRNVSYSGETVDVYVAFLETSKEDGSVVRSFELYQMIGQGRYRKYTGTWKLEGNILSGTYSSKKAWGSTYEVSVDGATLKLTSVVSGEVDTYRRITIPENVKKEAYAI